MWEWLCTSLAAPLTCDRFASDRDHVLDYYNTFMPQPAHAPVDAFAQCDWVTHRNWCHPAPQIIDKLVYFLDGMSFEPSCVIFCPYWPAHPWFGTLLTRSEWVLRVSKHAPPLQSDTPFDYVLFGLQSPLRFWGPDLQWIKEPPVAW